MALNANKIVIAVMISYSDFASFYGRHYTARYANFLFHINAHFCYQDLWQVADPDIYNFIFQVRRRCTTVDESICN